MHVADAEAYSSYLADPPPRSSLDAPGSLLRSLAEKNLKLPPKKIENCPPRRQQAHDDDDGPTVRHWTVNNATNLPGWSQALVKYSAKLQSQRQDREGRQADGQRFVAVRQTVQDATESVSPVSPSPPTGWLRHVVVTHGRRQHKTPAPPRHHGSSEATEERVHDIRESER